MRIRAAFSIRSVAVAGVICAVVGTTMAAALVQPDVTGVWEITLDTQTGEHVWTATFEQDGAALGGEVDMHDGEGALPVEGTVDGTLIRWGFVVPDLDGDMPINLSGAVEGATISGDEGSFVWYGTGVWSGAKR